MTDYTTDTSAPDVLTFLPDSTVTLLPMGAPPAALETYTGGTDVRDALPGLGPLFNGAAQAVVMHGYPPAVFVLDRNGTEMPAPRQADDAEAAAVLAWYTEHVVSARAKARVAE